jgi:hypothetical protein
VNLRHVLLKAAARGAALAVATTSCVIPDMTAEDAGTGGGAATFGTGGGATGGGMSGTGGGSAGLPPIPTALLTCEGPVFDGGYFGQCCARAFCPTVPFRGSGVCVCSHSAFSPVDQVLGPFSDGDGGTCFVASAISCVGRPLTTDEEEWVVAPVVPRSDWV